jgi:hypothetical protein
VTDEPRKSDRNDDRVAALEARIHELHRTELVRWADAAAASQRQFDIANELKNTLSWRITAPLRAFRSGQLSK